MSLQFKKAVKFAAKGRVALIGPAGSGKSYTSLILARLLAGPEGKIAAIDTEHGSLSKYADLFDFDVIELDSFSPENFLAALTAAEQAGYAAFVCDSLSHFWMGKDGALEFVDLAGKRYKDNMGGWKEFRPHERQMVDRMIASPCHVLCTMRTKTDYQEVTDANGKKKRVKVGLAPVQRDGLEYEFDLVGYMDDENTLIVDKTRCSALSGKAIHKPSAHDLEVFRDWLNGVTRPEPWSYRENRLRCQVLDVQTRTDKQNNEFIALKHNGRVNGKDLCFCFDSKLFNALREAKEHEATLLITGTEYATIADVLAIEGIEYREGRLYEPPAEPPKPKPGDEPVPANAITPDNPISDDDLPF